MHDILINRYVMLVICPGVYIDPYSTTIMYMIVINIPISAPIFYIDAFSCWNTVHMIVLDLKCMNVAQ